MSSAQEHLKSIQSRIDELEHTIAERGEQIRHRTKQLKDDLQDELSPEELIRKHPVEAAGVSLVAGIILGRIARGIVSPGRTSAGQAVLPPPAGHGQSALKAAIAAIGVEAVHAGKDLAVSWIKSYFDQKKGKAGGAGS